MISRYCIFFLFYSLQFFLFFFSLSLFSLSLSFFSFRSFYDCPSVFTPTYAPIIKTDLVSLYISLFFSFPLYISPLLLFIYFFSLSFFCFFLSLSMYFTWWRRLVLLHLNIVSGPCCSSLSLFLSSHTHTHTHTHLHTHMHACKTRIHSHSQWFFLLFICSLFSAYFYFLLTFRREKQEISKQRNVFFLKISLMWLTLLNVQLFHTAKISGYS